MGTKKEGIGKGRREAGRPTKLGSPENCHGKDLLSGFEGLIREPKGKTDS